jgi:hypothetical protein
MLVYKQLLESTTYDHDPASIQLQTSKALCGCKRFDIIGGQF